MKLGLIGAGNMAQAIVRGLEKTQTLTGTDIVLHGGHPANYEPVAASLGATAVASNLAVYEASDLVILAVEPSLAATVAAELKPALAQQKPLVSLLTGVALADLQAAVGSVDYPLVRVMPNLNVEIGEGMTAYAANAAGEMYLPDVLSLFGAIGDTIALPEKDFSTFVALAGSSPAFVYMFIDAMARAGVKYGLTKQAATAIAAQAVLGSGAMVKASEASPFDLMDKVSSPGGTTVAGVIAMESAGFMPAVFKGIDATINKDRG